MSGRSGITIAVEGCCHGELDNIYESIKHTEKMSGHKVDLLICCGDFQAVRNLNDLSCMACPDKYKSMNTYFKYYSGEKIAPVLTIFVGGNHEASNHLQELYYGGWVAPNIYYLGNSGIVRFGGLVIGGISGIFKIQDYRKGQYERPPYNRSSMRSVFHTREVDVFKLAQYRKRIDIFVSHDWPRGVYHFGNKDQLVRKKPFFRDEVQTNTLGSPAGEYLLQSLQPSFWFAAHLHVKFAALVQHPTEEGGNATSRCPPAPTTSVDRVTFAGTPVPNATKFLALDKCLARRHFLQLLRVPMSVAAVAAEAAKPLVLEYDAEWLAIVKKTHHLLVRERNAPKLPAGTDFSSTDEELAKIRQRLMDRYSSLAIPNNFAVTAKFYRPTRPFHQRDLRGVSVQRLDGNPQTDAFLELLGLQHRVTMPYKPSGKEGTPTEAVTVDDNEIDLDDLDADATNDMKQCADASVQARVTEAFASGVAKDINEIDLDDDDSAVDANTADPNAVTAKPPTPPTTTVPAINTEIPLPSIKVMKKDLDDINVSHQHCLEKSDLVHLWRTNVVHPTSSNATAAKKVNSFPKRKRIKLPPPINP